MRRCTASAGDTDATHDLETEPIMSLFGWGGNKTDTDIRLTEYAACAG